MDQQSAAGGFVHGSEPLLQVPRGGRGARGAARCEEGEEALEGLASCYMGWFDGLPYEFQYCSGFYGVSAL